MLQLYYFHYMRLKRPSLFLIILSLLCLQSTVVRGNQVADTLAKYSNEELFDKAFYTHNTFYLEYLERRKLSVDETKLLYQDLGRLLISEGKLDSALIYYTKLDSLSAKTADLTNQVVAKLSIGELHYRKKEYKKSQAVFEAAQPLIEELPEGINKILSKAEYSYFYYLSGKFDLFIEQNLKNLEEIEKIEDSKKLVGTDLDFLWMGKSVLINFIAHGYTMKEDFTSAEKYLNESKAIIEKHFPNDMYSSSVMRKVAFGQLYLFKKEYDKAIPYLQDVINLGDSHNFKEYQYKARIFLAIANYQKGNYSESLKQAETAIHSKVAIADYIDFEMEALRYAYLSSKAIGATEKAMEYSRLFIEQDAAMNDNRKSNFVNSFINNLEVSKLEEDIKSTNNSNNLLRYGLTSFDILTIGLILFSFYQVAENKAIRARIEEYMDQMDNEVSSEGAVVVPLKKERHVNERIVSIPKEEIDEKTSRILDKLMEFEQSDLFVDSRMSLSYLASYLGTNTITLSKIINTFKEMNFNDYINGLRIRYIIDRIKNEPQFEQYKISYLAEVSGFSSHSIFSKAFKKSTGVTPSQFLDYLKEEGH